MAGLTRIVSSGVRGDRSCQSWHEYAFLVDHNIPDVDLSFEKASDFFAAREVLLTNKLMSLLNVASVK